MKQESHTRAIITYVIITQSSEQVRTIHVLFFFSFFLFVGDNVFIVRWPEEFSFRRLYVLCRLWVCNKIRRSLGAESRPIKFAKLKSNYSGLWIRDKRGEREKEKEFSSGPRKDRITDSTWQKPPDSLLATISWRSIVCRCKLYRSNDAVFLFLNTRFFYFSLIALVNLLRKLQFELLNFPKFYLYKIK